MNAQEYNLNIRVGYGFPQTVKISQDDVGRPLSFHLLDGAEALTIPSGATVTIHGTKPSGLGFSETCTVTGSTASIETTLEMSQEFGNCPAELVVAVGDDLIGTANFTMFVERSPHPENTIDGTFDVADSIFARMDDLEDELEGVKEDIANIGLSNDLKTALLQIADHVYYDDDNGAEYVQDLYNALYPPATLLFISATYTQSGTVYDTDTLDSLKEDLVVTGTYDNGTTAPITDYVLSGTLETGTSTITVTYSGKTATFTVTVTHAKPTLYTLSDTTFDGTFSIDSGVKPLDVDRDFAIAIDLTSDGTATQASNARIYNFEGSNSGSSLIWAYGSNKYIRLSFAGTSSNILGTAVTSATSFAKFKLVINHEAESGKIDYWVAYETSGGDTGTLNDSISSSRTVTSQSNMFVGGYSASLQFLNGVTINSFTVYSEIMTTDEINAFIAL